MPTDLSYLNLNHQSTVAFIAFKSSVRLSDASFDPHMQRIRQVMKRTAPRLHGDVLVVTSSNDGTHSKPTSRHYIGCAEDYRYTGIRDGAIVLKVGVDLVEWQKEEAERWAKRARRQLGPDYRVRVERTHIHVAWRPMLPDGTQMQ